MSYTVTAVGVNAFNGQCYLISVKILTSVTTIGINAFLETGWGNSQPFGIVYLGDCAVGYRGTMTGEVAFKDGTRLICDQIITECYGILHERDRHLPVYLREYGGETQEEPVP